MKPTAVVLIHQHAPSGVDDDRRGLHQSKSLGIYQRLIFSVAWRMNGQIIAASKQLVQIVDELHVPALAEPAVWKRFIRQHAHLESGGTLRHSSTGTTEARSEEHTSELQSQSNLVC